jgi:hypothetical protein
MLHGSWDLWTPMWAAQLQPTQDYDGWLAAMEGSGGAPPNVDAAEWGAMQTYQCNLRARAEVSLGH